jgi:glycosyltransferase involved in cell wall biosynthesis
VRETIGLLEDETLFLFCGRLEKKDVDVLFDAIAKMDDRISFKVAWCGEGDLRNKLNEQANRLGIQHRLHWLGLQSDVSQFYAAADIYIMPSRWESFGLVFLETMNYETPILSTKTQTIPEVVEDQVCGLLSENEDSSQLANNMAIFLNDKKLAT